MTIWNLGILGCQNTDGSGSMNKIIRGDVTTYGVNNAM